MIKDGKLGKLSLLVNSGQNVTIGHIRCCHNVNIATHGMVFATVETVAIMNDGNAFLFHHFIFGQSGGWKMRD